MSPPHIYLPNAVAVEVREKLTLLACEPHDVICLVRKQDGAIGELPTFVIGRGNMVAVDERELWEMALAARERRE